MRLVPVGDLAVSSYAIEALSRRGELERAPSCSECDHPMWDHHEVDVFDSDGIENTALVCNVHGCYCTEGRE